MAQPDPFDEAMERLHNAQHAAKAANDAVRTASEDVDAALLIGLQNWRTVTSEKGSLRDSIAALEQLILQQNEQHRADRQTLANQIAALTEEIRHLRHR